MNTTYTPGQWVADFNGNIRKIVDPSRPLMDMIVGAAFAPDELGSIKFDFQRANARLMAQAPALLDALRQIEAATAEGGNINKIAREAIAAATQE